jgi:hypothetical protein
LNPWKILGIEQTTDRQTIKRAYVRLIKLVHPEDDPAAFQRVRQAYEEALKQIDFPDYYDSSFDSAQTEGAFDVQAQMPAEVAFEEKSGEPTQNEACFDRVSPITELLDTIKELLGKEPDRNLPENWTQLLSDDLLWNIETKKLFGDQFFQYIADLRINHFQRLWLPKEVWSAIESQMHWRDQEMRLYKLFPEDMVNSVLDPIRNAMGEARSTDLKERHELAERLTENTPHPYAFLWRLIPILLIIFINHRFFCNEDDAPSSRYLDYTGNPAQMPFIGQGITIIPDSTGKGVPQVDLTNLSIPKGKTYDRLYRMYERSLFDSAQGVWNEWDSNSFHLTYDSISKPGEKH